LLLAERENFAVQVCSLQRYQRHQSTIAAAAAEPTSLLPNQLAQALHSSCSTAALR